MKNVLSFVEGSLVLNCPARPFTIARVHPDRDYRDPAATEAMAEFKVGRHAQQELIKTGTGTTPGATPTHTPLVPDMNVKSNEYKVGRHAQQELIKTGPGTGGAKTSTTGKSRATISVKPAFVC